MPTALPTIGQVLHRMDRAGAEVLAAALARRLRDRYRFVFLCLDGVGALGEELKREGFGVFELGRQSGIDLKVAGRIRRLTRSHGIDLLHAHQYTPFFYAALSRRLGSTPAVLFTEHGRHYPDRRHPKRVLANRWLLKPGDRVTAVGQFVKRALIDHEGIAEPRITVVYNGIDPDAFAQAGATSRTEARAALGIADDVPVVMQVARFHPVKDHGTAVRALARCVEATPDVVLCLVGDGDKRAEIESLCNQLGVGGHVRFLGVRADVQALLPAADVFMLSSLSEGLPVTLLEAMATGLPIVATEVGGNGEVVEHGVTGLLSPRGDDASLAAHLGVLLADSGKRRAFGEAGRGRLLDRFTQQRMHQQYAEFYNRMLGR